MSKGQGPGQDSTIRPLCFAEVSRGDIFQLINTDPFTQIKGYYFFNNNIFFNFDYLGQTFYCEAPMYILHFTFYLEMLFVTYQ